MLTPQEVAQRSFSKASFGGYNMAMVDDFLDEVTADYEALYNDNALLKQKLGVLSGKIREYQSTEEAMRKTLLAAQEMSEKLVKETQAKCDQMLAEAEGKSAIRKAELEQGLRLENQKLQTAQAAVAAYKEQVRAVCQQQLEALDRLEAIPAPEIPKAPEVNAADAAAQEIQAAVAQDLAREDAESAAQAPGQTPAQEEPAPAPGPAAEAQQPEEDPTAPTRRVDRRSLEFGKDFEID